MGDRSKAILRNTCLLEATRLDRIYDAADAMLANPSPASKRAFEVRCAEVDTIYSKYREAHTELMLLLHNKEEELAAERLCETKIDDVYYSIKAQQPSRNPVQSSTQVSSSSSNVRLPKIELPQFDGNLSNWPGFHDLFSTLIDTNSQLTEIEKHQYLLSSLSGDPLKLVRKLPLSQGNYTIAYKALVERYHNKRLLATHYFQSIYQAPVVSVESAGAVRSLIETFSENVAALKHLGFPTDSWDFVLFNLLLEKIDSSTRTRFEIQVSDVPIPTYIQLHTFLSSQCKALEGVLSLQKRSSGGNTAGSKAKASPFTLFATTREQESVCEFCKQTHLSFRCPKFVKLSSQDRFSLVKRYKLCINCLKSSHYTRSCSSSGCKRCDGRHHTMLHFEKADEQSSSGTVVPPSLVRSEENSVMLASSKFFSSQGLLATAVLHVVVNESHVVPVRALLDPGSQINVMTDSCSRKLGLKKIKDGLKVVGLNTTPIMSSGWVHIVFTGAHRTAQKRFRSEFVVIPKICASMPSRSFSVDGFHHLKGLQLADPDYNRSQPVEILLGVDIYSQIIANHTVPSIPGEPSAMYTDLGWIVMGRIKGLADTQGHSCCLLQEPELERVIQRFWEVEEVPTYQRVSPEDAACEKLFCKSFSRSTAGRYIVPLPFRGHPPSFDRSRDVAVRRFYGLERRLWRTPKLANMYADFMRDYLDQGHMEVLTDDSLMSSGYYIPHHGILNENRATTKLRVVFDASARDYSNLSLNDSLLVGPKLQSDIVSLLLNFRMYKVVLIADIRQMYRQILVDPSDCNYQKIVWRFKPSENLQDYRLLTVTYGVSSAPYLALRTLKQLAVDYEKRWPMAAQVVRRDMYVDDVITGCSSLEEAHILKAQLIELFRAGGFTLHKWSSNNRSLFDTSPVCASFEGNSDTPMKVLGLRWSPLDDVFFFQIGSLHSACSKRVVLSQLAQIFDPLGFLTPVTVKIKMLLQFMWSLGLGWDDVPPSEFLSVWMQFQVQLPELGQIRVPRRAWGFQDGSPQLHAFCDASEKGYAAVLYLRHCLPSGVKLSFLLAKGKVAPVKRMSLPRLELCAAHLLSKLVHHFLESSSLEVSGKSLFAWTDSMVALSWIRSSPHRWKTFVGNRVALIHECVPSECWRHVPTKLNPADCGSRGLLPAELTQFHLWWQGPDFLLKSQSSWPIETPTVAVGEFATSVGMEERLLSLHATVEMSFIDQLLEKWSSLDRILHTLAYCFRFYRTSRGLMPRQSKVIPLKELQTVLELVAKLVERDVFDVEIQALEHGHSLPKTFRKLNPFIDEVGLIRVGGRLSHSTMPFRQKHPILLPGTHRFTTLLIEKYHREYLHPGVQSMQYLLVQNFWILGARRVIRRHLSSCIRCFRLRPRSVQPKMGDLPALRISQLKPFECVGVDFGGPFSVTMTKHRGVKSTKAYICLFVCFSTKAIHIELVSDLSSDAFLAALRRFVGRRGRCSRIFSDCGTNFVGAARQLASLMQHAAEHEKIEWSFNPPSAPNFGGLWEAGIKSTKTHLYRVIGDQVLTYEELNTVLIQIEAVLNSRPLCALSTDPNDLQPLTPGHFLTLEPLTVVPENDFGGVPIGRLARWQLLQRLHQDFWRRWQVEYLHTLQQRSKWFDEKSCSISEGALVLVKNETVPPQKWPLGRVVSLHPGPDTVVRVVSVRMGASVVKRPISKLCPLPTN